MIEGAILADEHNDVLDGRLRLVMLLLVILIRRRSVCQSAAERERHGSQYCQTDSRAVRELPKNANCRHHLSLDTTESPGDGEYSSRYVSERLKQDEIHVHSCEPGPIQRTTRAKEKNR